MYNKRNKKYNPIYISLSDFNEKSIKKNEKRRQKVPRKEQEK